MRGVLSGTETDSAEAGRKGALHPSMTGLDLATRVSTPDRYEWSAPVEPCSPSDLTGRAHDPKYHVVAYDYGIKHNILRRLAHVGAA